MKKIFPIIMALIMCVSVMTACGKGEGEAENPAYSGILTRVKLGMPLTKIVSMQPDGIDLYYEDDTTIWSINPDTDLAEISALIPAESAYFYTDDSIITYYFNTVKGDDEIYLNGYTEEIHCLMDRTTAEEYFNKKTEELVKKHCVAENSSANGTMTGTEDVDMTLVYNQSISASSYDLVFSMTLSYDTVDGVDGYYATMFEISLKEKAVKNSVPLQSTESKDKDKEKETKEEETEKE